METYIRLFRCIQPWLNRQYSRMGISEIQASIILALTTEKVCEQHKVAEMICLGKGTVSKVVKQLEADGYIQIERRRKDKRIRVLRPTHKAYYLSQQIQSLHHMMEEILLGDYLAGISEHLERIQASASATEHDVILPNSVFQLGSYLRQVKNPYCVKVGNFGVELTFLDEP